MYSKFQYAIQTCDHFDLIWIFGDFLPIEYTCIEIRRHWYYTKHQTWFKNNNCSLCFDSFLCNKLILSLCEEAKKEVLLCNNNNDGTQDFCSNLPRYTGLHFAFQHNICIMIKMGNMQVMCRNASLMVYFMGQAFWGHCCEDHLCAVSCKISMYYSFAHHSFKALLYNTIRMLCAVEELSTLQLLYHFFRPSSPQAVLASTTRCSRSADLMCASWTKRRRCCSQRAWVPSSARTGSCWWAIRSSCRQWCRVKRPGQYVTVLCGL